MEGSASVGLGGATGAWPDSLVPDVSSPLSDGGRTYALGLPETWNIKSCHGGSAQL